MEWTTVVTIQDPLDANTEQYNNFRRRFLYWEDKHNHNTKAARKYISRLPKTIDTDVDMFTIHYGSFSSLMVKYNIRGTIREASIRETVRSNSLFWEGYVGGHLPDVIKNMIWNYFNPCVCDRCGSQTLANYVMDYNREDWCWPCWRWQAGLVENLKLRLVTQIEKVTGKFYWEYMGEEPDDLALRENHDPSMV